MLSDNWTLRRIQEATGVRRETAGAYLKAAGLAVRPAGRWGHPPPKPAIEVSTDPAPPTAASGGPAWVPGLSAPAASACTPYRELIELAVARGRTAMAIWRDLVDDHGFPARYASVRRFVGQLRGPQPAASHPASSPPPARRARSTTARARGARSGHPEVPPHPAVRLHPRLQPQERPPSDLHVEHPDMCELHEENFRHLGGTVQVVVLDNLREGVLTADIYDPTLNPALPRHARALRRGGAALSRRRSRSQRQSRVGHRPHADRPQGRQVAAMFVEEQPHLRPLPVEPFRYYQFGRRTMHLVNCIEVDAVYCSATSGLQRCSPRSDQLEDWGKLLGDTAAVTALLDRLLHHAHVLTCGPRSWRTRLHGERAAAGA